MEEQEENRTGNHTPGPWQAVYNETTCQWYVQVPSSHSFKHAYYRLIARVGTEATEEETCKANAKLIAAAPAMYRFLKDLVNHKGPNMSQIVAILADIEK